MAHDDSLEGIERRRRRGGLSPAMQQWRQHLEQQDQEELDAQELAAHAVGTQLEPAGGANGLGAASAAGGAAPVSAMSQDDRQHLMAARQAEALARLELPIHADEVGAGVGAAVRLDAASQPEASDELLANGAEAAEAGFHLLVVARDASGRFLRVVEAASADGFDPAALGAEDPLGEDERKKLAEAMTVLFRKAGETAAAILYEVLIIIADEAGHGSGVSLTTQSKTTIEIPKDRPEELKNLMRNLRLFAEAYSAGPGGAEPAPR